MASLGESQAYLADSSGFADFRKDAPEGNLLWKIRLY
jgi:hypothetical protein